MTAQQQIDWRIVLRNFRLRHGYSRVRFAAMLGITQRTLTRWEGGQGKPAPQVQRYLLDLTRAPIGNLPSGIFGSIMHCPLPRALSRTQRLTLLALSPSALAKRPSMANHIGRDLAPLACGVLAEMLDDRTLQRSIAKGEIACVLSTTKSVLRSAEHSRIGAFQTTITYFFEDGTLYSDALSVPAPANAACGYRYIPMDACSAPGRAAGS